MEESEHKKKRNFLHLAKKAYNKYIRYKERREFPVKYFYAHLGYKILGMRRPYIKMRKDGPEIIFVDVSSILQGDSGTGIHRVTKEVSKYLINNKDKFNFNFIATSIETKDYVKVELDLENNKINFRVTDEQAEFRSGDKLLFLDYAPAIMLSHLATYRALKNQGVKLFFIVHDLLPSMHPEWFFKGEGLIQKAWLREMSQLGKMICVSRSVEKELEEWSSAHNFLLKEGSGWFHHGYNPKTFTCDSSEKKIIVTDSPVFLTVSTVEPRKGHAQILDAFDELWAQGEDVWLVFVGFAGWKIPEVWRRIYSHPELGKRLFWYQGISDAGLGELYRRADAVIMASQGEGFGLSIIEGASNGKPLILRDLPVFKELAGENAFYFHGNAGADLSACIRGWLSLWEKGQQPFPDNINIQSWQDSARQLLCEMEATGRI